MSSTTQTAASRTTVAHTPTAAVPRAPLALLVTTGAIIFLANAGLLVLQLLAGRYLAPFIGSSIETWTAVIGVFLTGIAIGNWVGGRVADRYPSTRTLAVLLIVGGLSCLTPIAGMLLCEKTGLHSAVPLGPRIPLLAALFCLLPATLLSMITPLVIKLAIADVRRAGRVAGVAFALSTLGCLLGNYLTGFWLMAEYRLDTIAVGVTVLLVAVGALQFFAKPSFGSPAAPAPPPSAIEAPPSASSGIDLRGRIGKAYAIVFIASFCGMSLELTGSRVLAPILGVSLYSWHRGRQLPGRRAGRPRAAGSPEPARGAALRHLPCVPLDIAIRDVIRPVTSQR
jgi:MFS family permease